jgi:hypothetical protein
MLREHRACFLTPRDTRSFFMEALTALMSVLVYMLA